MNTDALAWLAAEVRRVDHDRYLSALFAREPARRHLLALYAFNHEIAKTAETVHEPMAGLIRLQWWRGTLQELYAGRPPQHAAALALAETLQVYDLPKDLFIALIDARESDFAAEPFADIIALEAYADATSANIMRLAARILGAGDTLDTHAREIGIAYGLMGLLRALPYRAARRHSVLPANLLREEDLDGEGLFAGRDSAALKRVTEKITEHAYSHLKAAQALPRPGTALPALLPGALCSLYLRLMARADFNPFRDITDIPVFRRQFAMLRAALRGYV